MGFKENLKEAMFCKNLTTIELANKTESSIILFILTLIMTVYFLYKVIYGLVVFNYRKNK